MNNCFPLWNAKKGADVLFNLAKGRKKIKRGQEGKKKNPLPVSGLSFSLFLWDLELISVRPLVTEQEGWRAWPQSPCLCTHVHLPCTGKQRDQSLPLHFKFQKHLSLLEGLSLLVGVNSCSEEISVEYNNREAFSDEIDLGQINALRQLHTQAQSQLPCSTDQCWVKWKYFIKQAHGGAVRV